MEVIEDRKNRDGKAGMADAAMKDVDGQIEFGICPRRKGRKEVRGEMRAYLGEDGGGEAGDDAAAEGDGELARAGEVLARLLGHAPEDELVAELVHRELPDRVRDLPVRVRLSIPTHSSR